MPVEDLKPKAEALKAEALKSEDDLKRKEDDSLKDQAKVKADLD